MAQKYYSLSFHGDWGVREKVVSFQFTQQYHIHHCVHFLGSLTFILFCFLFFFIIRHGIIVDDIYG